MRSFNFIPVVIFTVLFGLSTSCTPKPEIYEQPKFTFEGRIHWNPDNFSPLPQWAPFEMSMQLREDTLNGRKVLTMQLLLHNVTEDSVFLLAGAGGTPHYDFVVTQPDSTRIWNRLQSNARSMVARNITIEPGGVHRFQHTWDYTDYEEKPLKKGEYLIYGGIEYLSVSDKRFEERKKLGETGIGVGVGVGPDTLVINGDENRN